MPAWVALIFLLACGGRGPAVGPGSPEAAPLASRAAKILAEAIRIPTVNPPGDEAPLANYLVGLLREAGLEAASITTPPVDSRIGRAAAWGVLPGRGDGEPLVLLSHLDVVPAEASEWRVDPFGGVREPGRVLGRGAQDAKGVAVIHLLALLEIARSGRPLGRDVIYLATPDEETGGVEGASWILRERRDLLRNAAYLLTEGGGVLQGPSDTVAWHVAVTEKTPCWLAIDAEGPPGHSSVPPQDAAVERLIDALLAVRALERPLRVVPEVARMFAALAPVAPPELAPGFANLPDALADDATFRERFLEHANYRALVQDTLAVTVLEGAARTNVLPPHARAHIDARLLPDAACETLRARVQAAVEPHGARAETLLAFPANASPVETPLWRALAAVAQRRDPGAVMVPSVVPGFTDAHWFRDAGLVAYGFVPRRHMLGEPRGVHGPNEWISTANLEGAVRDTIAILRELDRL